MDGSSPVERKLKRFSGCFKATYCVKNEEIKVQGTNELIRMLERKEKTNKQTETYYNLKKQN